MNMDLLNYKDLSKAELNNRIVNIRIRINGIVSAIKASVATVQPALRSFLGSISSNGSYVPSEYWKQYQSAIINVDSNGLLLYSSD